MSRRSIARVVAWMLALLPLASLAACGTETSVTSESMTKAAAAVGSVNGLCPVMERLVTKEGGSADYKGQKVAFCCAGCVGKFNENPEKWVAMMKANPTKYGYKP